MIIRIDSDEEYPVYSARRIEGDTAENRDEDGKNIYGRQRWVPRVTFRRWERIAERYAAMQEEMRTIYEADMTGMGKRTPRKWDGKGTRLNEIEI